MNYVRPQMTAYCPNCSASLQSSEVNTCLNCKALFSGADAWMPTASPVGCYTPRIKGESVLPDPASRADGAQVAGGVVLTVAIVLLACFVGLGNIFLLPFMAIVGVIGLGGALFAFSPRKTERSRRMRRSANRGKAQPNKLIESDAVQRRSPPR